MAIMLIHLSRILFNALDTKFTLSYYQITNGVRTPKQSLSSARESGVVHVTEDKRIHWKSAIRISGAFVATIIGSGFASGQELVQFFTVYNIAGAVARR